MAPSAPSGRFVPLGGKSRNFRDTETGAIISRRQKDKIDILARQGFTSFEAKAKANRADNKQRSIARPARGRASGKTVKSDNSSKISKLKPLKYQNSRVFSRETLVYIQEGGSPLSIDEIVLQFSDLGDSIWLFGVCDGLRRNPETTTVSCTLNIANNMGGKGYYTLLPSHYHTYLWTSKIIAEKSMLALSKANEKNQSKSDLGFDEEDASIFIKEINIRGIYDKHRPEIRKSTILKIKKNSREKARERMRQLRARRKGA